MKALMIVIMLIAGLAVFSSVVRRTNYDTLIRTHKFKMAMPAADVRRSLGEPMGIIPNQPNQETWIYPAVAIVMSYGQVSEARPLTPEAARQFAAAASPRPVERAARTPAPTQMRGSMLDRPAHR